MTGRFLTDAERGDLVRRFADYPDVSGLDRLTVFQLLGASRLMAEEGRVTVDVRLEDAGRLIGRSLSTIRTSISRLRTLGLLMRDDEAKIRIDLTPLVQRLGCVLGAVTTPMEQALRRVAEPVAAVAEDVPRTRQLAGGSRPSNRRINNNDSTGLESKQEPAEQVGAERICQLMADLTAPEVLDQLPHGREISELIARVHSAVPEPRTLEALRDAAVTAIPAVFRACQAGSGITRATAQAAGERMGAGLVLGALYALVRGAQPKGLFVSIIRSDQLQPQYALQYLERHVAKIRANTHVESLQQAHMAEANTEAQAKADVTQVLRTLRERLVRAPQLNVEALSPAERLRFDLPKGQAALRTDGAGRPRLVLGLSNSSEYCYWKNVVERLSSSQVVDDLPEVVVLNGALRGGHVVRMSEAWTTSA